MGVLLKEVGFLYYSILHVHIYVCMMTSIVKINVDSNKTQKPGTTAFSDLPDPEQSAIAMRTTRGCAAKRDTNGKLVYALLCMYVHNII